MNKEHLHFLRHDKSFTDDEFKAKEIEKYEEHYTGLKIIKPNYHTDNELEKDWKAYLALPYHLKAIADEKSLFLFGKKNEEIYKMAKSKFLQKDIAPSNLFNDYRPGNLREAENFFDDINSVYIIPDDIDNLDTLNLAWEKYLEQDDDQKETSDSVSFGYYGKTVPEMYNEMLKKLNEKNIDNNDYSDILNTYSPPSNISEAFMSELDYIVDESKDIIEKAIFFKKMNERANTNTLKTMLDVLKEDIDKRFIKEEKIDIFGANFFLPEEIIDICENFDDLRHDNMFLNYAGRFFGIKPYKTFLHESIIKLNDKNATDMDMIKLGWNPVMEYSENNLKLAHNRCIKILNENLNCNYIPLQNIKGVDYDDKFKNGMSIVTIYECDRLYTVDDGIPRVLVNFNCLKEDWYQYTYSQLMTKLNINNVLNEYKDPLVDVYFVEMDKSLYDDQLSLVSKFNLNDNSLKNFTSLLKEATPDINNSKVFVYRFVNGLLESNNINNAYYSIYHLLSEFGAGHRDIINSHKKLAIIEQFDNYDNKSNYLHEIFNINILKEAQTLPIEFDEDGNMFIKKKENIDFALEYNNCHKLLKQYEKVENYEAIKYYVAKLWYMNILIEKRLYQKNKSPELQQRLPEFYKTRAHILNDFNIYMSKILEREPDFNFQEYYENTPFNQSVVKISKNLLQKIWLLFKTLIFG